MKPLRSLPIAFSSTALLFSLVLRASAAGVWDGGDTTANWSAPLNWDDDLVPTSPLALTFDGTTQLASTNDLASFTASGITFNVGAGAFVIGGNALTLGGNIVNNSSNVQTLATGMTLAAGRTVNAASGDIVLSGPVTGGASLILTKIGTGKLTLSGTGGLAQLSIGNGNAGGPVELAGGAWTQNSALTGIGLIVATGATSSGTLAVSGGTHTFGGDDFNGAVRIGCTSGASQISTGSVTVTGGLVTVGMTGALNAAVNLGTQISGGGTSTGTLTISGGEMRIGSRLLMAANNVAGTGTLTLSGSGILNMSRTGTTDPGLVRMGSGIATLNLNGGTLIATGILTSDHTSTTVTGKVLYNGTEVRANASGGNFGSGGASTVKFSVESGGLNFNSNGFDSTIASPLLNSATTTGALTKTGTGTLSLSAANTFNGTINVNGGTLAVTAAGTLPATTPVNIGSAGNLRLDSSTTRTLSSVTLADGASLTGLTGVPVGSPRATVTNAVTFSGPTATVGVSTLGSTLPAIGSVYDVIQAGSFVGSPILTATFAPLSRLTGTAALSGNKLQVTVTGLGSSLVWKNASANNTWDVNTSVNFLNGASNDVFKNFDTVVFDDSVNPGVAKSVALTGTIYTAGVTVNNSNGDYTFTNGTLAGPASLLKSGSSALTLTTGHSYTGTTTVNGGLLSVASLGGATAGNVTLSNPGSTIRFMASDPFGQASTIPTTVVTANSGTVVTNNGVFVTLGTLNLNGATLTANGGASSAYQAFKLAGTVNVTGSSTLNAAVTPANANTQIHVGINAANSQTTFNVVGSTDTVAVTAVLRDGVTGQSGAVVKAGILKAGAGTMTISTASTYTGDTTVQNGTLSLGTASLPDAADVRIATGTTLDLPHGATDTVHAFYIDGILQAVGTWGGTASSATHKTRLITGTGILQATSGPSDTPYSLWALSKGLIGANAVATQDPDHDGLNNYGEFAFDGDPLATDSRGRIVTKMGMVTGEQVLTITLPVRDGAFFYNPAAAELDSLPVDGVNYQIQGSTGLVTFDSLIEEITDEDELSAVQGTLPADHPLDTGWTYRSFYAVDPINTVPKQFIRARVTDTP